MLRKTILVLLAAALLASAVPTQAGHTLTKQYVASIGDYSLLCAEAEETTGYCLGGTDFPELPSGNYVLTVTDDNSAGLPTSGAVRVEDGAGNTVHDNVDTCFDTPLSLPGVPSGGVVLVWIDGVVWWALGQPCGLGQLSQGTTGTVTLRHL